MTVLLALKSFPHLANYHVQVLTDNITTAAYVNHLGMDPVTRFLHSRKQKYYASGSVSVRNSKLDGGRSVSGINSVRVAAASSVVSLRGSDLRTSHSRQIPKPHHRAVTAVQQSLTRLNVTRCGRTGSTRLKPAQQLRQRPLQTHWPSQLWHQKLRKMALRPPFRLSKHGMYHGLNPEPYKNPKWRLYACKLKWLVFQSSCSTSIMSCHF